MTTNIMLLYLIGLFSQLQCMIIHYKNSTYVPKTKETNSKGSTTNSINKSNLQIIYGNSKDISRKKVKYKQDLQKIEEYQITYLCWDCCVKESFKRKKICT